MLLLPQSRTESMLPRSSGISDRMRFIRISIDVGFSWNFLREGLVLEVVGRFFEVLLGYG